MLQEEQNEYRDNLRLASQYPPPADYERNVVGPLFDDDNDEDDQRRRNYHIHRTEIIPADNYDVAPRTDYRFGMPVKYGEQHYWWYHNDPSLDSSSVADKFEGFQNQMIKQGAQVIKNRPDGTEHYYNFPPDLPSTAGSIYRPRIRTRGRGKWRVATDKKVTWGTVKTYMTAGAKNYADRTNKDSIPDTTLLDKFKRDWMDPNLNDDELNKYIIRKKKR